MRELQRFDKEMKRNCRRRKKRGKEGKLSYSARAGGVSADLSSAAEIMASDRVNCMEGAGLI